MNNHQNHTSPKPGISVPVNNLDAFIIDMPKVELHVHLEGSIEPSTLLKLAHTHQVELPADTVEGLREWYTFTDFAHFAEVYQLMSSCIRTVEDIELIAREFLVYQAAQHIHYSEVTYTAYTHYLKGISFEDQLAALKRAIAWSEKELDTTMGLVIDIPRIIPPEEGMLVAEWCVSGMHDGVIALGLGGPEIGYPPELFEKAFDYAYQAGLPCVPHAGETVGAESIWGSLKALHACRIGHGVRCLEDSELVQVLKKRRIPLEVCPTSNICLKVAPDMAHHPFPRLMAEGLVVTVNSDDPAMFNTTLTNEFLEVAHTFHLGAEDIEALVMTALDVSLLPDHQKKAYGTRYRQEFEKLYDKYGKA